MGRKVITITHPNGDKRVIVSKQSTAQPTASNASPDDASRVFKDRRPKPGTPKISITNEKNGYKYGGKVKLKTS